MRATYLLALIDLDLALNSRGGSSILPLSLRHIGLSNRSDGREAKV